MAVLPEKLVQYLNNQYDLGSFKFGTELQRCLTEVAGNPTGGSCIVVPSYTSQAAAQAACGKTQGVLFLNQTTEALTYCSNGNFIELDFAAKCVQIDANTANLLVNSASIATLITELAALETTMTTHNHDGVNSAPIDIKTLITTEPVNSFFYSTGSGIDCRPIQEGVDVFRENVLIQGSAEALNFSDDCFSVSPDIVTTNGVFIDIPDLPALKLSVAANTAVNATNTASISSLATQVAGNSTDIATAQTDITNLNTEFDNHTHDGTDSVQIPQGNILSQDATSTNLPLNFVACADGAGGWTYIDKNTLIAAPVTIADAGATGSSIIADATSPDFEFKTIEAGCGIAVTNTASTVEIAIDQTTVPNVGTALDVINDTILIHDDSANTCVRTSIQSLGSLFGGVTVVDDLADADTTTTPPAVNDVLTFDGTNWVPAASSAGAKTHLLATKDVTQTPNGTPVIWDDVRIDTDSAMNAAGTTYTVPTDGCYQVEVSIAYLPTTNTTLPSVGIVSPGTNGTTTPIFNSNGPKGPSNQVAWMHTSATLQLTAGDTIQIIGGGGITQIRGFETSWLSITRVGD